MALRRIQQWNKLRQFTTAVRNSLHTSRRYFADDNKPKSESKLCDPGVCPKHQMDMKQMLDRKEMEGLQPSRSKFAINTFSISRPHVPPVVNPELEEMCLKKKKCEDLKKGKKDDKENSDK